MQSKRTQEINQVLKRNFSKLVQAGIPTNAINAEYFCYFLDHSYFIGQCPEDFEITKVPNADLLFLYEFIVEHFGFEFSDIEWEIERRLYRKLRYSNPIADAEGALYFAILKQKIDRESEFLERILVDENLFERDLIEIVESIEELFVIDALNRSSSLKRIEFLVEDHSRKSEIKAAYLSLVKRRGKVFDTSLDAFFLDL